MALLYKYVMNWSGWNGGPGYSTLYGSDVGGNAQDFANAVASLFNNICAPSGAPSNLPSGVKIQGNAYVDTVDPATGHQTGVIPVVQAPAIVGTGVLAWVDVAGFSITWITAAFISGRRVKGRTYFVPMDGVIYENNGTLTTAFVNLVAAAISTYIASANVEPVVWHRPTTQGGSDGQDSSIMTGAVKDHASILTSRRVAG